MNRLFSLALLSLLFGCNSRPDPAAPAPKPDVEPPLTDMRTGTDSLYMSTQYVNARTATNAIDIVCEYGITANGFRKKIREVGVCLSATDSVLSIRNPLHIRAKAVYDSTRTTLTVSLTVTPGQRYFMSPYFMLNDGRVYYGSRLKTGRWQFASWGPQPAMNAVTSFSVSQPDPASYRPITLISRASVPTSVDYTNDYFFTANDNLYLLGRTGALSRYDAGQDKWVTQKPLTIAFDGWPAIVFALNNKGYVLYTNAMVPNLTFYWEYDPIADNWTSLPVPDNIRVAPLKTAYQVGNELLLRDTFNKNAFRFDPAQKRLVALPQSSLLITEPYMYRSFVPNAPASVSFYSTYTAWKAYSLNIATYNAANNQFSNEQVVSTLGTDTAPRLAFASGTDLFLGIGDAIEFLPNSRVYTKIYTKSDDLIRYSPQTKQLIARYDISALRAGYRNGDAGNYRTFAVDNQTLVVDTKSGKMWALRF